MKQPTFIIALLLIAANLFSQQTKTAEIPKKSISYAIDTVTADSGFYLIEQIKDFVPGSELPKVTNNPYYYRDTAAFMLKIVELKKSAEFKIGEANKKIEEAKQLNLEGELRLRQAEILTGLLETFREPTKVETPLPVIKQDNPKKTSTKKPKKQ